MSFELQVSDEAIKNLYALIDSLPTSRRRDAIDAVDAALEREAGIMITHIFKVAM